MRTRRRWFGQSLIRAVSDSLALVARLTNFIPSPVAASFAASADAGAGSSSSRTAAKMAAWWGAGEDN